MRCCRARSLLCCVAPRSSKARDEAIFKVLQLDNETDEHGKYIHISPDDMPIDIEIADELITVFQVP